MLQSYVRANPVGIGGSFEGDLGFDSWKRKPFKRSGAVRAETAVRDIAGQYTRSSLRGGNGYLQNRMWWCGGGGGIICSVHMKHTLLHRIVRIA